MALKSLTLPRPFFFSTVEGVELRCVPKLINKRKGLESITLPTQSFFKEIVSQIYTNCENLVALTMEGRVGFEKALAIVTFLPNIKKLVLCTSKLPRKNLLLILAGFRELELLDVTNCRGFDAGDTEILSKASHIKTFKSEGTT
ncbi:F-box/LRR-repeat protein [Thalictrum thalictroides]|uniref:F-box/LRR-repeat protein n=1 Tax=Thalictrum thalictroides TaxID=46969 RepID=A0A7J6WVC0_THATH|nr:F-box/LRR-repeat protein [Thalictrum thalictroides]